MHHKEEIGIANAPGPTNDDYVYFASESVGEGHPDKLCD